MKDYKKLSESTFNIQAQTYDTDKNGKHARNLYGHIIDILYEIAPMVLFRTMGVKLTFSCTKIMRFRTIKLKRPLHRMREYMIFSMQSTP